MTISIHSLVKRETYDAKARIAWNRNFNPLPRKEGDTSCADLHRAAGDFNPLPRKEGDTNLLFTQFDIFTNFNPLPRKEGDPRTCMTSTGSP